MLKVLIVFLSFTSVSSNNKNSALRRRKQLPIIELMGNFETYLEMSRFLTFSINKFGADITCHTIIWEQEMSSVVDYMDFCRTKYENCIPNYFIKYEPSNGTPRFSQNFTTALKSSNRQQCQSYIILLRNTTNVIELLRFGDDFRTIDTRGRFLVWYGEESKSFETEDIWKKLPNIVFFHTKVNRRQSRNKKISFKILSLKWPIMPNSSEATTKVIDFWRNSRLARNEDTWFRDKTTDLRNLSLRILTVDHPPSVIKYRSPDGFVEYAGTEIEVIKELSIIMNFDFDIVDADPLTKWGGALVTNRSQFFYGAVARLVYGEVDMAIGAFMTLKKNLDFLDMSFPLDVACTTCLVPNPLPKPRYLALILPFQPSLWALVVIICVLLAPLGFYAMAQLPQHADEFDVFKTKWDSLLTSISIMSQVALHVWPRFWAMRMLIGWYWLFCLLVTLAYRCAMVAFLTIPLFERNVDDLKDLAASGLRVGGWGPELKNLFTQKIMSDNVEMDKARGYLAQVYEQIDNYDTGINFVSDRVFALYDNVRYLRFILRTRNLSKFGSPSMRVMKQCILPVHIGIAYQKNSPIVPTINSHIRRFQESGLMKKWSQRLVAKTKAYYKDQEEANLASSPDFGEEEETNEGEEGGKGEAEAAEGKQRKQRVLSISDLQGSIYLVVFGIFSSILAFIVELVTFHIHKNKEKILQHSTVKTTIGRLQQQLPQLQQLQLPNNFKPSFNSTKEFLKVVTQSSGRLQEFRNEMELNSILREMGVKPKRKEVIKGAVRRKWKRIKDKESVQLYPYVE